MVRALSLPLVVLLWGASAPALASSDEKGVAERKLLGGEHPLTVQWIGWQSPGRATVKEVDGVLHVDGAQRDPKTGDFLTVKGKIVEVAPRTFVLEGEIRLKVGYLCEGAEAVRTGRFVFKRTGKRKYWRMQEMNSPCDVHVDYVDLYLRR